MLTDFGQSEKDKEKDFLKLDKYFRILDKAFMGLIKYALLSFIKTKNYLFPFVCMYEVGVTPKKDLKEVEK